jgi:hypothetical protein
VLVLRSGYRVGGVPSNSFPIRRVVHVVAVGAVIVGLIAWVQIVPGLLGSLHRVPVSFPGRHGDRTQPRLCACDLGGTPVILIRSLLRAGRWCSRRRGVRIVNGPWKRRTLDSYVGTFDTHSRSIGINNLGWLSRIRACGLREDRSQRLGTILRRPRPVEGTTPWTAMRRKGRWAIPGLLWVPGLFPWRRRWLGRSWSMI